MPAAVESPRNDSSTQHSPEKLYTLQILSYSRGRHPVHNRIMPYHWTFLLTNPTPSSTGTIYQLKGMPGAFHYDGPEPSEAITELGAKVEEIDVGEVPADRVEEFERIVSEERIEKREYGGWNCQDWTLGVLGRLNGAGFVFGYITPDGVKGWLKEEGLLCLPSY
ncbi:hypothetical protein MMC30_005121 [Trapelia coarctata]|nr:hypothetical protein [Trapelia coarctata]